MTRIMDDAAYPPPDPHVDVCAFYIGGDTPHVWSDEEIAATSERWRLPIYVCDNPGSRNGAADGAEAVAWLRAHHVPAGSTVALDYEMAINGTYVTAFDKTVTAAGWRVVLYGSLSTVTRNPRPSAGYWTASWTGTPHLDAGAAATQYVSDTQLRRPYDLSEVADTLTLWDTQTSTEDDMFSDQDRSVLDNVSAFLFEGGTSSGDTPPGGTNNSLVQKVDFLIDALQKVQTPDPAAFVAAFAANPQAMDALATALAGKLPAVPTVDEIAAAVATHFGTALDKG